VQQPATMAIRLLSSSSTDGDDDDEEEQSLQDHKRARRIDQSDVADRMKSYEREYALVLNPSQYARPSQILISFRHQLF
jgi:hypothetical protein